jgi:hypothetical protein
MKKGKQKTMRVSWETLLIGSFEGIGGWIWISRSACGCVVVVVGKCGGTKV